MKNRKARILAGVVAAIMLVTNVNLGSFQLNETSKVYAAGDSSDEEDYTAYADPFVGTDVDFGQLFPGAVTPNGLVKLSPDTYPHNTDDHAGYDYSKTQIEGFSHTRIEGVGGQGAGGDILLTPTYVQYDSKPTAASRAQSYSHNNESASPGIYSVELTPKTGTGTNYKDDTGIGKIKVELTANTRTGYHKYTFPKDGRVSLVVDLNYTYHGTDIRNAVLNVEQSGGITAVSGRFSGRNVSGHGKYTMYFYMETSQPAAEVKTWLNSALTDVQSQEGNDIGAVLSFDAKASTPLQIKVGVSPVSSVQAKKDMYKEMSDWDFDAVYNNAKAAWNDVLGKVKIENSAVSDPDGKLKKLFYTHLYHMFTTPVNATSTDDTFRATDLKVYKADDYTHYDSWTLWDDFRKYPIIGLVLPEVYKDYIRSIADTMEYGIGTWGLDTQTVPTVRTEHAVALLADGVAKGFDDIDNLESAYETAKNIADGTVDSTAERLGYIKGRVDRTVEASYDDWAISLLAKNLDNAEDFNKYLGRSFFYKNLYKEDAVTASVNGTDTNMGLLWPKDAAGNFMSANPEAYGDNSLYQGTLWQYTWWNSNDVNGLLDLIGSKEKMARELHYLYGMQDPGNGRRMLHTNSNEIDLHTPYLFNFVGEPYNTQYWVRQIYTGKTWNRYSGTGEYNPPVYDYVYKLDPQGFLETMDDDAGTMASMYVAAAMGLFPMAPGDTTYQIGTPFFDKVTIDVGNGKQFVIEADNVSSDNYYIQSATLNGKNFDRTWIDYSEIIRGGTLKFQMGSSSSDWAVEGITALSSSDLTDTKVYDTKDMLSYSATTIFESDRNDGSVDDTITISLQNTDTVMVGEENEDLISSGRVTVSNVPEGLTASAVKLDDTSIRISFSGNAVNHNKDDSIGNLSVSLDDSLFSKVIISKRKEKSNIKIMFRDDTITFDTDRLYESADNDGTLEGTVIVSLSGNGTFDGADGEDFIADGKLYLSNLPDGLSAGAVKTGEKQLELTISGQAKENEADVDDLGITFEDSAFSGAAASEINGSNYGGMKSLILDFAPNWEERLAEMIEEGRQINPSDVTANSFSALKEALENGQEILDQGGAAESEYRDAYETIIWALDGLVYSQSVLKQLEAEQYTIWSGGNDLKTETSQDSSGISLGNLGGTYDGAWIGFEKLNFGTGNIASFTVRYVNNSSRCAADSAMEIHLGSPDGELLQTVSLSPSGSSWNAYTSKTVELDHPEKLTGTVDVYFVLKGTGAVGSGTGQVFAANLDWMKFNAATTYGIYQAENYSSWSAGNLKTETSTTYEGESLSNIGATYDGAWISYNQVLFGGQGLGKIAIRYAGNTGRCGADARIELHLDSPGGELIDTIPIAPTNPDWSHYVTAEKELAGKVTGLHDIYLVMRAATTGSKPYVANLDWFSLIEAESDSVDKSELQFLYNFYADLLNQEDKYEAASFTAFKEAMVQTKKILDSVQATKEEVEQMTAVLQEKKAALIALNLPGEPAITPDHVVFDKYTGSINYGDKTVMITEGGTLTGINNGSDTLSSESDYTVTGSAVTIYSLYLETLKTGTTELSFQFSDGTAKTLTILVTDTTPRQEEADSVISPVTAVFNKYKKSSDHKDVVVTMTLNGNTLTNIKNGTDILAERDDYTVSGSAVTVHTTYLDRLKKGTAYLTFTFSSGKDSSLSVRIVDTKPSSPSSGHSSGASGSVPSTREWEIPVVTDNGTSQSTAVRIPVSRTTSNDGTVKDIVQLKETQAAGIIKNALETRSTIAVIDLTGTSSDKADSSQIQILKAAATLFGQNNIAFTILTEQAGMVLPAKTMTEIAGQDVSLTISDVKEESQIAKTKDLALQMGVEKMLHSPIRIETNYALKTQITLPIQSSDLPTEGSQLKEFTSSLAVLVEHSDGEIRLKKGTIQYDKTGKPTGISVWVDKFSTFTLVKTTFDGTVKVLKNKQMPDKELNVRFGQNLDSGTVSEDNVYVLDSKGNKIDVTIACERNSIKVIPVNYYNPGETYTFYITKNVLYESGLPIIARKYEFTIGNILLGGTKINTYQNVPADKIWSIKLDKRIDIKTYKNKYVTVVDQYCNIIKAVSSVVKDSYIKVIPQDKYKSGNTYYIIIDGLNFDDGTAMDKAVWIKFSIK
ncbi:GH92 family glycosyl hydrolase [Anaerocolumna sp. MB42-C2]|uniref:GH92 family glycosyl hydrolase n=1 Tax=Anaerocolumna sp. MB42-C2 TaxID=3070997 RepID=UPI0027E1F639|nr:GH92 family glycosyl hydrolase [Anaerocolumna sp. MB42-C2]WMJ87124.1 GH92 family glycosyl hydrolase [Anaerocolumna sp. MB42-C2]